MINDSFSFALLVIAAAIVVGVLVLSGLIMIELRRARRLENAAVKMGVIHINTRHADADSLAAAIRAHRPKGAS